MWKWVLDEKEENMGMKREARDWVERNGVEGWIIEVIQSRMEPSILSC